MSKIKKIIFVSMMLACNIVLSRFFSIKTPFLVVSFSFVPLLLTAYILGYKSAIFVGLFGDLIGALLFPMGAYFPGFTVSGALMGLVYGTVLYNKKPYKGKGLIIRLIISSVISCLLISGALNTFWLYIISKKAFLVLLPTRLIKELIMIPVQVITMYFLLQNINIKKLKND